jgi:hypothetical protein
METKKNTDNELDNGNRKQFPLKSDKYINNDLKRNYRNFIDSEPDLPDWPSNEEINVSYLNLNQIKN